MILVAMALAAVQPRASEVVEPLPPSPPAVVDDPATREAIQKADACVSADDGRSKAMRAVRGLTAGPGSRKWEDARAVVADYIGRREIARNCINELERIRFVGRMSPHDRAVVTTTELDLLSHWLEQSDYENGILAALIRIPTDAGHYPIWMHRR